MELLRRLRVSTGKRLHQEVSAPRSLPGNSSCAGGNGEIRLSTHFPSLQPPQAFLERATPGRIGDQKSLVHKYLLEMDFFLSIDRNSYELWRISLPRG